MRGTAKEATTRKGDAIFGTHVERNPISRFTVLRSDVVHATSSGHPDDGKAV